MAEVDSDEENQMKTEEESIGGKKPTYTKLTRDVSGRGSSSSSSSSKKQKIGSNETAAENIINPDEIEYEDDEEYYQKLMAAKENEKEDEMDMLRMQLQFEKEEAERKAKAGAAAAADTAAATATGGGQPKTRIDADGTEYEWDPMVKGWFPKVNPQFCFRESVKIGS